MWQKKESKLELAASHGKRLSVQDDFTLSDEKIGDYYMAVRHVLTNIFGRRQVLAYVTSAISGQCIFKISNRKCAGVSVCAKRTDSPAGILCHFCRKSRNQHKIKCLHKCLKTAGSATGASFIKL